MQAGLLTDPLYCSIGVWAADFTLLAMMLARTMAVKSNTIAMGLGKTSMYVGTAIYVGTATSHLTSSPHLLFIIKSHVI